VPLVAADTLEWMGRDFMSNLSRPLLLATATFVSSVALGDPFSVSADDLAQPSTSELAPARPSDEWAASDRSPSNVWAEARPDADLVGPSHDNDLDMYMEGEPGAPISRPVNPTASSTLSTSIQPQAADPVPEPSMVGLALGALFLARRKRSRHD
jgi:hypothetical protein